MLSDDRFDPTQENDFIIDSQNKEIDRVKSLDTGYGYVYRYRINNNGIEKRVKIDCYSSSDTGTYIRNAETGQYYKYKVGSKDEDRLFKLSLSTGVLKTTNRSSILFYDSPEQYERHLSDILSDEIKEKWMNKRSFFLEMEKLEK
jgi:hypothetical protein